MLGTFPHCLRCGSRLYGRVGPDRAKIVAGKHLDEPAIRVGRIAHRSLQFSV